MQPATCGCWPAYSSSMLARPTAAGGVPAVGPVCWGLVKLHNVVECVLVFALMIRFSCF